jgi:hypothetical protein
VHAAVFTDAIMVKTRVGRVASRPAYAAIAVTSATGPARPGHDRRSRAAGDAGLAGYGLMEWLPEVAEGDFRVS